MPQNIINNKKIYKRLQQSKLGRKLKNVTAKKHETNDSVATEKIEKSHTMQIEEETEIFDGRCTVDLKVLGQQLWFISCKEALYLNFIKNQRHVDD